MSLASFKQNRDIRRQLEHQLDRHRKDFDSDGAQLSPTAHARSEDINGSRDVEKEAARHAEDVRQAQERFNVQNQERGIMRRASEQSRESVESAESPEADYTDRAPRLGNAEDARSQGTGAGSRASRSRSIRTIGTRLDVSLAGVHVRNRTTKEGGDRDKQVFVVGFEGDDDLANPKNWSKTRRVKTTCLVAAIGITVGIASAIDAEALRPAASEFGVAPVAESLATGIFLIGFGFGALFAGPVSEMGGRLAVYIVTLSLFGIWIMASALSPNFGAQCAFRFLAGFFGSTPLTCAGGSIADMWDGMERTLTFPVFANAAFTGKSQSSHLQ